MKTGINISIKQRIYGSFSLLVCLFVLNGIITILTINTDKKLSTHLSKEVEPSLQVIEDFESVLIESKMHMTNWVFLRFDQEDKELLKKLHDSGYTVLKSRINLYASGWENKSWVDSLNRIYMGFEELLAIEKNIMSSLQEFNDYDDPVIKLEAERKVEEEILPRTAALIKSLHVIHAFVEVIRTEENTQLERSSMKLRMFIILLAITIICAGFFLSVYLTKLIIRPVNRISHIINDLGLGIIQKIDHHHNRNEMGKMIHSVNNLSEKLQAMATFAHETGLRNFDIPFKPLSDEDTLGKALIAMRDNIKSSDSKLNQAQHIAKLGSFERDLTTGRFYMSDEMFNISGIDKASFDHSFQSILKLIHPEDLDYFKKMVAKVIENHQPNAYECRIVPAHGFIKNIFIQSKIVLDAQGNVTGTIGVIQDITERKQSEEKLAEERELFRLVIENIPDQIYLKDTESRFMLCNMPVIIHAGCTSQAEMIGKTDFDFFPEEIARRCFEEEQTIIRSGIPLINHEEQMVDKITGKLHWSLSTKFPLRNNTGEMIGLIGINHEITSRKIAQEELEVANRELSILFNSIDEIFFSVNMVTLKVIQISATCEKVYGYTQSEFLNNYKLWLDIIHPDDKHLIENEDEEMRRGKQINNQYRVIRRDKIIRWIETTITPTLDKDGNLIRVDGITRDITKRKNAEAELHKSEERYRQIAETAQEGIWMIDENNNTTFTNKKMCEIIEYSPEEIMGKKIHQFMDEDANKNAPEQIERRKQGISETHDAVFITKTGKDVLTSLSTNPVFDDAGVYKGALAMVTDITKRKHDEELIQKSQLSLEINNYKLEQKNKELEQFAYVASHDLQEPLRTTISFVEILRRQYFGKLDAKADKYLNYIVQSSDRMKVLIKDLLDFSRIGINKDLEKVDCNIILQDVITDLDKAIKDSNAVIKADHLPVISGYSTELKQLFQNLIINSIKFRKKNVPPRINISAHKKNDYWRFEFADNGIGIDQQHNERIFIIFQRLHTRTEYQGSGIGLSHCKKIVELHHGKIWVESTPNEGSAFYFTIHIPKEKINEPKIKMHNAY